MWKMGARCHSSQVALGCSHELRDPALGRGTDASTHLPFLSLSPQTQCIPAAQPVCTQL